MPDFHKFYEELNPQQKEAVSKIEGPLLVLAGPGTGKTQLLSVRAANILLENRAQPENILILTYTNSAAKAMKERLSNIIGLQGYTIVVGTFHSFANSIITESEEAANYLGERVELSDIEKLKCIEHILDTTPQIEAVRPFGAPYTFCRELLRKISELKNEGLSPPEFKSYIEDLSPDGIRIEEKHLPRLKALSIIYENYEELKRGGAVFDSRGRYDYDDMILFAKEALQKEPALREKYLAQFKYIMVDEYQDTNGAQLSLLFLLLRDDEANLCCVGDDDQSIYRFQGASSANFKSLKERFPDLSVITLRDNYRSTDDIISLSARIIRQVPDEERVELKELTSRKDYLDKKIEFWEFTTEEEELLFIIKRLEGMKGKIDYDEIAVLVRKRAQILKVLDAFQRAGIPYATDGKEDISKEKRVRQISDLLELACVDTMDVESRNLFLYNVLTADYLGLTQSEIFEFFDKTNKKRRRQRAEGITLFGEFINNFRPNAPGVRAIKDFIKRSAEAPLHEALLSYISESGLYRYILRTYEYDHLIRIRELRGLASFLNMVKEIDLKRPGIRLPEFIEELRLQKEHNIPIQGELVTQTQHGVRIYTAHGSKGLEFHTVIIPFCIQDKSWPIKPMPDRLPLPSGIYKTSALSPDKERLKRLNQYDETRLFYVAASRAKSNLLFTASPTEDSVASFYFTGIGVDLKRPVGINEEKLLGDYLTTARGTDGLEHSKDVLEDMVRGLSLNPTSLNNYLVCKRKFFYDNVLMLPGEKKQSLIFGTCAHKAAEETYKFFGLKSKFPTFDLFEDAFKKELSFQGVNKSIENLCLAKLKLLKGWFERASLAPVKPFGLEQKVSITLEGDIPFTGKYDKLELEDEEERLLRVIDYKTGEPDRHIKALYKNRDLKSEECDGYLRQLVAYKLLFDNARSISKGCKIRYGVLEFLEPVAADNKRYGLKKGEYRTEKLKLEEDMVGALVEIIRGEWRDIQGLRFEKLLKRDGKDKCRHCDFDRICWG